MIMIKKTLTLIAALAAALTATSKSLELFGLAPFLTILVVLLTFLRITHRLGTQMTIEHQGLAIVNRL